MLRLSKRVEYALLAVQCMAADPHVLVSAKDVADRFGISFTLVAKVLQQLAVAGYVRSIRGVNGGYSLAVPAERVSIADVIEAIEGKPSAIVDCHDSDDNDCIAASCCTIRQPLGILQERIAATFASMTIAELVRPVGVTLTLP
jgi:Rrf2 family protein